MPIRYSVPAPAKTLYVGRALGDLQERCIIRFEGQIDAERLSRAVCITIGAEPLLGCRFVEHPWRPYWRRLEHVNTASVFNLIHSQNKENEIQEYLARPMNACVGPQIQVALFRSKEDTLCVKLNHLVADGAGFINYIGLLAKTYRELKANPEYVPETNTHSNRVFNHAFRHTGPLKLFRALTHESIPRSGWGEITSRKDRVAGVFEERHIETIRLAEIKAYCRRQQVTLTDVLLTAFYRALFNLFDPPMTATLPVAVTVDLRRHLPPIYTDTICDLASAYFVTIRRSIAQSFTDTLAKVRMSSNSARANQVWLSALFMEPLFMPGFCFGKMVLRQVMKNQDVEHKIIPIFSNMGVIQPGQVEFGDTVVSGVTLFGPTPFRPSCDISISTFNNRMSFTASSYNAAVAQSLGQLLDAVINELPRD